MLYKNNAVYLNWLDNDILELVFNSSESVNKLNKSTLLQLKEALDIVETLQNAQGLIVRSDKDSLIVGADITEFLPLFEEDTVTLANWLNDCNVIFNRLEDLSIPTLAIVNGYALGGGCETILACDFRIAVNDAKIGLPETKLGLIPGFGGTVRLPRLIGADNAMEWITTGKAHSAQESLSVGVVDSIVSADDALQVATDMLNARSEQQLFWKQRKQQKCNPLTLAKTEAILSFTLAKSLVLSKVGTHYPAPILAVEVIKNAAFLAREEALKVENDAFVRLAKGEEAKSLISIFLNDQTVKKKNKILSKEASKKNEFIGVLGAGIMGGGIAYQAAYKRIPVLLKDIHTNSLGLGLDTAAAELDKKVKKKQMTSKQMGDVLNRIMPALDYVPIWKNTDIVIEAVVENQEVKQKALQELEMKVGDNTIITSNTSTISIDSLAENLQRPEHFCGMHFFNPVPKMPLVEIVRGSKTSDKTIAQVTQLANQMGKTAIIVNDCPGFFINRVLFPYFHGFSLLLQEGVNFEKIDAVMSKQFGWPMGPAYLLDVIGIDTACHAEAVMAKGFPSRMRIESKTPIQLLLENEMKGQKNLRGFFEYSKNKKGFLDKKSSDTVHQLLKSYYSNDKVLSDEEIIDRMMLPMMNESMRCFFENIVASPQEADLALLYGLGFPAFRGGIFRYIDTIGLPSYVEKAEKYSYLGEIYQVVDAVTTMINNNQSFYEI